MPIRANSLVISVHRHRHRWRRRQLIRWHSALACLLCSTMFYSGRLKPPSPVSTTVGCCCRFVLMFAFSDQRRRVSFYAHHHHRRHLPCLLCHSSISETTWAISSSERWRLVGEQDWWPASALVIGQRCVRVHRLTACLPIYASTFPDQWRYYICLLLFFAH